VPTTSLRTANETLLQEKHMAKNSIKLSFKILVGRPLQSSI